ncbi:hypothetical protein C8Q72DRAFT_792974 [Fomitopsis betulina]|nr:hypothetical protein C8Q72DRAFT_792974 [Fomitopsis betulina]
MYPGKNYEGWWNMEKLVAQVQRTIAIRERMFPGDILEFFFDQSSAHGAFAKDALNAKDMNVKPGGKQRRMRDTHIPQDNPNATLRGRCQSMVFPLDLPSEHPDYNYRGQPKGMLRVREERDLVASLKAVNGGKLVGECSVCKLSREAQERLLREAQAAMILDDCPVKTIRAFFRKAWRYMDAYRKGLNAKQAEFAVKKYRSTVDAVQM